MENVSRLLKIARNSQIVQIQSALIAEQITALSVIFVLKTPFWDVKFRKIKNAINAINLFS